MHRPRNRQPRASRQQGRGSHTKQQTAHSQSAVPPRSEVAPGTYVSIVMKADQTSGRETAGFVKDLLTRGDHPRGIKVRLQDDRVGRVQKILAQDQSSFNGTKQHLAARDSAAQGAPDRHATAAGQSRLQSLADYFPRPDVPRSSVPAPFRGKPLLEDATTVQCPLCGGFEGDEAAVSHHVQTHLT